MAYGALLERRRLGTYYFRQTAVIDGRQVSRRFSLGTKDVKLARFLALQLKAQIAMADLSGIRTFEIEYDEQHRPKRVKTVDEEDAIQLQRFLDHEAREKALAHQRVLELHKLQAEERERQSCAEPDRFKELREKLERDLTSEKQSGPQPLRNAALAGAAAKQAAKKDLKTLQTRYLQGLSVSKSTAYRYGAFTSKFISYAASCGVTNVDDIDNAFVHDYFLALREVGNEDATIKNLFNMLATFWNRLVQTGATKNANPFTGQVTNVEENQRQPFEAAELERIFSDELIKADVQLYFILLLQLTSAARPNEICQLWTDDFVDVGDFWTIRLTRNKMREQTLKNNVSPRTIYLHRLLVEAGFLEYLKTRKLGRVFDVKRPSIKTWSTFVSAEFSAHLRRIEIADKTMYCLRHTANNRMKHASGGLINVEIRCDLMGQKGKTTNEKVYSTRFVDQTLRAGTEDALNFSEVKALHPPQVIFGAG